MEKEEIIIKKLDTLVKLSTVSLIEGKIQKDQVILLSKVGFAPKEIANLIGTTPNTVRVTLTSLRKKRQKT